MSEEVREVDLLSRDELDAILEEASSARQDDGQSVRLSEAFRRDRIGRRPPPPPRLPELREAVERTADGWAQALASRHQRRIACSLIGWEELDTASVTESLLPTDRITTFDLEPGSSRGLVMIARPLFFGLMALAFGGRRVAGRSLPERDYTRIERRFLRSLTGEILARLESDWRPWFPYSIRAGDIVDPAEATGRSPAALLFAAIDVTGISSVGRVRIGFPVPAFQAVGPAASEPVVPRATELESALADVPVTLRAEIGRAELSLRKLGELRPGDTVPLERSASEGYLLRIGGAPKFVATRGSVNGRLAVQVIDRLEHRGAPR